MGVYGSSNANVLVLFDLLEDEPELA